MMDEVTYEIETQAAAAITNIGGDQTVYSGERRSPIPRLLSLAGLTLSFSALGLLVYTGIGTANELLANDSRPSDIGYYTDAIASTWQPAVILLVAGIVLSRVGRVLGRR
jgi:hypothetical protein